MKKISLIFWLITQLSISQQAQFITFLDSIIENHPAILSNFLRKEAAGLSSKAITPMMLSPYYSREEWGNGSEGIISYGIQTGNINPWEWKAEKELLNTQLSSATINLTIARWLLIRDALFLYANWAISLAREKQWTTLQTYLDSLYIFAKKAYETGQIDIIQLRELEIQIQQTRSRIIDVQQRTEGFKQALQTLLQLDSLPTPSLLSLPEPDTLITQANPLVEQQRLNSLIQALEAKRRIAMFMPSLFAGYSQQVIEGQRGFMAIEIGVSIPLNTPGVINQSKAYQKHLEATQLSSQAFFLQLQSQLRQLYAEWQATQQAISIYQTSINQAMEQLLKTYQTQMNTGAISPMDFIISYRNIVNLNDEYFVLLEEEANLRIQLLFLTGKLINQ